MASHPIPNPQYFLGKTIDNNSIRLSSILGIGAYGVVYMGRQVHSPHRPLAVKLLLANAKATKNEIKLHRHVSGHRQILRLRKIVKEEKGDYVFLVLEYATGGDLFSAITQGTHGIIGDNRKIRYLFLQLLDAVEYCHRRGISHRDLKPENILLMEKLEVRLADFGLATTHSVSAEFGCGSTFYFSPECQSGLLRDHQKIKGYGTQQNDIWSLGVILINLVTGRNPWRQATMEDSTFAAYTQQPNQFFSAILPTISAELDELLQRIFCLDPAHRISLPELKWRILECKSFLRNQPDMMISARQKKRQAAASVKVSPSPLEQPTLSITQSIWEYTNDFAHPIAVVPSSSSSSSSSADSIGPATPPLVVPGATCTKISHDALVDLIQASSIA